MSVTIASTTATQAELNQAAEMVAGDELVSSGASEEAAPPARSEGYSSEEAIARTPNVASFDSAKDPETTRKEAEAVQSDLDARREERAEEYLQGGVGKTRRKLLARLSRAHAQNESLREKVAQLERGQQPTQPQQQQQQNGEAHAEAADEAATDFGDDEPLHEQQQLQQPRQPVHQQQGAGADQEFVQQFQARVARLPELGAEARERIPGLESALKKMDEEYPVSFVAGLHIQQLENPFDVAAHLSRHPEVVARLWSLESAGRGPAMLQELNNLSVRLQDRAEQAAKRPRSSAPAPISPVGGGASTQSTRNLGELPYQEYKRIRDEQERRRR